MRLSKFWIAAAALSFLGSACVQSGSETSNKVSLEAHVVSGLTNGTTLPTQSGANVLPFTVNGSTCSAGSYSNKPCVSIQVCNPGTTTCVTVNDILLDTGSYGLRVFKTAISGLALTQVISSAISGSGALAECAKFGDGSSEWGSIKKANLIMGGETASNVPIQVIDPSFGTVPASCGHPDASVAAAGFNGILGVGLYAEDCGAGCLGTHTSNQMYFSCTGGNTGVAGPATATCPGGTTSALADQVQNPVSLFPTDNNGVLVQLPAIPSSGAGSVDGYLIFGIGTQANNSPTGLTRFQADAYGYMTTTFNGQSYSTSFLDTGSNGLYFQAPSSSPVCSSTSSWYCPTTVQDYSAVNYSSDGSSSGTINFQIANASALFNSGKNAFSDLGGNSGAPIFDYGLPIFFGRNVFVGIDGKPAGSFGTGPFWAY
jgi:hypothetical protein